MNADDVLEAMKRTHWQQAKGHLLAMLETYHSMPASNGSRDTSAFDQMRARIEAFVTDVEGDL
jgi:hypothetical protein